MVSSESELAEWRLVTVRSGLLRRSTAAPLLFARRSFCPAFPATTHLLRFGLRHGETSIGSTAIRPVLLVLLPGRRHKTACLLFPVRQTGREGRHWCFSRAAI